MTLRTQVELTFFVNGTTEVVCAGKFDFLQCSSGSWTIQTAFEHLFQRLNATEVKVMQTALPVHGTASTFRLANQVEIIKQRLRLKRALPIVRLKLELNDIGFMFTQ